MAMLFVGCNGKVNTNVANKDGEHGQSQIDSLISNGIQDSVEIRLMALHEKILNNKLKDTTLARIRQSDDEEANFLSLAYGMERDDNHKYTFRDSILDHIPTLISRHFIDTIFQDNDTERYKAQISLSIYIDRIFPNKTVRSVVEKKLDRVICKGLYDEYKNGLSQKVYPSAKTSDIFKFWKCRFAEFVKEKTNHHPLSEYSEIAAFRLCVVAHKIFEDSHWATYIVQHSLDIHGSCGCGSESDYLTISKSSGDILNIQDAVKPYNKDTIEELVYSEYLNRAVEWNSIETFQPSKSYFIDEADGVAKTKHGLLFYYKPYTIGCGAEGQYNLVINPEKHRIQPKDIHN